MSATAFSSLWQGVGAGGAGDARPQSPYSADNYGPMQFPSATQPVQPFQPSQPAQSFQSFQPPQVQQPYFPPPPLPPRANIPATSAMPTSLPAQSVQTSQPSFTRQYLNKAVNMSTEELRKVVTSGMWMKFGLTVLFVSCLIAVICVSEIKNQRTTPSCWSTSADNMMTGVSVLLGLALLMMLSATTKYFFDQPKGKRGVNGPVFCFAFLSILVLCSFIMIVNVKAKAHANIAQSGISNCVTDNDYNAGIAGALLGLIASMFGVAMTYYFDYSTATRKA